MIRIVGSGACTVEGQAGLDGAHCPYHAGPALFIRFAVDHAPIGGGQRVPDPGECLAGVLILQDEMFLDTCCAALVAAGSSSRAAIGSRGILATVAGMIVVARIQLSTAIGHVHVVGTRDAVILHLREAAGDDPARPGAARAPDDIADPRYLQPVDRTVGGAFDDLAAMRRPVTKNDEADDCHGLPFRKDR